MRRSSFLRWRIRVSYFAIVNPCVDFPLTSSLSTFPLATSFRRPTSLAERHAPKYSTTKKGFVYPPTPPTPGHT